MTMRPLILGPDEKQTLADLREKAALAPVNMQGLADRLKLPKLKAAHMAQMTAQTVSIPVGFEVTFSIETGHPMGATARHLSVSIDPADPEKPLPHPAAVWVIAEELGFHGGLENCFVYRENFTNRGLAINVVQPIGTPQSGAAHG